MWSTRARLAATYAGLLFVTLLAFIAASYMARQAEVAQDGRGAIGVANQVRNRLVAAQRAGERLNTRDSALVDSATLRAPVDPSHCGRSGACRWQAIALPALNRVLGPLPGYFMVFDTLQRVVFSSAAIRQLPEDDQQELNTRGILLTPGAAAEMIRLPREIDMGGSMLLAAVSDSSLLPNISLVVGGVPTADAELSPQALLATVTVVLPLILLLSVAAAYAVTGNTFKPVDQLINEVEAITDGRSLHRRVPAEEADEELARLAETLNRMIGRLQTSFGALRRFTADASHELKTPLTVVRADVERAMHPSAGNDERMQALEEAMQEIARMSDLVDSLLTLARADEGRFDLHREAIHLEPLVIDVFETAVILGEDAGVTVALPLVEDAVVMGDATRLRQLFLNLITNAIKYTPRGGHVEITLSRRNNNEVGFAVKDTGVGIAAADLPHLFDRFWRADRVRSRRPIGDARGAVDRGGFGLGLSIAQWIAHAHGGTLSAQSRLARGSTFTVLLPIAKPDAEHPSVTEKLA
jgi:two-component system OmpR family sensor kinase